MRRLLRLACILALTAPLALLLSATLLAAPTRSLRRKARTAALGAWGRGVCAILGIRIVSEGPEPTAGPLLAVSNHLGYLDVPVLAAVLPGRFVARSDLSRWPVVGILSRVAGTLYVRRRSNRGAMEMVLRIRERLRAGDRVVVFPEGTSSDGTAVLPFQPAAFAAVEYRDGAPLLPVRLELLSANDEKPWARSRSLFCWFGDDAFVRHFWSFLACSGATVRVAFGEPVACGRRDRRAAAREAHEAVVALGSAASPLSPDPESHGELAPV